MTTTFFKRILTTKKKWLVLFIFAFALSPIGSIFAHAQTAATNGGFVPLTNLPVLQNLTTAPSLGVFFNALYKYCVGLAAVLAVLQIMRAGVMYMGGDSVTEVKQARALISTAILGLVLVLSPVIVFSIIDKRILTLNIGSDFSCLSTTTTSCPNLGSGTTP